MAILFVGPSSDYPSITTAMLFAAPSDTIVLEDGYSNEIADVLHSGMTIYGELNSTGIVLRLASGVTSVTLSGLAAINIADSSDGNAITGNDGDNQITVTAGTDSVNGGLGEDRLIVDYASAIGNVTGDSTSSFTEAGGRGRMVTITNGTFEHFTILTGDGADTITAGDGNDIITSGGASDRLTGGMGNDTLTAAAGDDTLLGNQGNDMLFGADGQDWMHGGQGTDQLNGGAGADTLDGGLTHDTLYGNQGNDVLFGSDGDDFLHGGQDNDMLYGGAGSDVLAGGLADDTMDGGDGVDIVVYLTATSGVNVDLGQQSGAQLVSLTEGRDTLISIENLFGSNFDDRLTGGIAANYIIGAVGNDTISAGDGNDRLIGDSGNDLLYGNQGDDGLYGGAGSDYMHGGQGNDYLNGDAGNDTLVGGIGNDTIYGGADADVFVFQTAAAAGVNRIMDFVQGVDKIGISGALAEMFLDASLDLEDALIWDSNNSELYVDLEALGQQGTVLIAELNNTYSLGAGDYVFV
ncbi:MAG: hypothetical protein JXR75_13080 [Rhodobacteraceae bacterium]|nr:hypothetical protein [Paracoccaceae bacterium]